MQNECHGIIQGQILSVYLCITKQLIRAPVKPVKEDYNKALMYCIFFLFLGMKNVQKMSLDCVVVRAF